LRLADFLQLVEILDLDAVREICRTETVSSRLERVDGADEVARRQP